ncbi:MAG: hypothetical protein LBM98_02675 [Oscillospiraceae bacterium]|nr:hypothetical protein [Oscillospiraceae bacterium]
MLRTCKWVRIASVPVLRNDGGGGFADTGEGTQWGKLRFPIIHYSLFTIHYSLLTIHCSLSIGGNYGTQTQTDAVHSARDYGRC